MKKQRSLAGLLKEMTLDEKIGQLNQLGASIYGQFEKAEADDLIRQGKLGSILSLSDLFEHNRLQHIAIEESRLGIPLLFADDTIHGIRTIFPTPLAESCSWEPELAGLTAEAAALEASALGIKWTFAPMVDVARDARWGRNVEGAGEDPLLGSMFAYSRVRGFQGSNAKIDEIHVAACAKHFAAYSGAMGGKEYASSTTNNTQLKNVYLPPFKACVEAGVKSVMTSFNDIDGIPCTLNSALINGVLRKKWNFKNIVVTDWNSLGETINHGYCRDRRDCAKEGILSGVNLDMASEIYSEYLKELIETKQLDIKLIDKLVLEILKLKNDLGLFENPYTDEGRLERDIMNPVALDLALESALKSIVLLENNGILPLTKKSKILLTGSLAASKEEMHGAWARTVTQDKTCDILTGLKKYFDVKFVEMFDFCRCENLAEDIDQYDAIIAVAGESRNESGEAAAKTEISLNQIHQHAITKLCETGKPVIVLLVNGRPLTLDDLPERAAALVECWQLGTRAGDAIAQMLSGGHNPEGRLTISFPRKTGQCPIFYNSNTTGRPYDDGYKYTSKYIDCQEGARYPFGYGLSYSDFLVYGAEIKANTSGKFCEIKVNVINSEGPGGAIVIQLYVRAVSSKPLRPEKELISFKKIYLKPGETHNLTFRVDYSSLGTVKNFSLQRSEPEGEYRFFVGKDSKNNLELKLII